MKIEILTANPSHTLLIEIHPPTRTTTSKPAALVLIVVNAKTYTGYTF